MTDPLLACQSLSKRYAHSTAVQNFTLSLYPQEFLAILGPSGCGKSTVLRLIAGFEIPDEGKIILKDQIVSEPQRLVPPEKRGVGMVFQDLALFPHLSVSANIAFGLKGNHESKKRRVQEMLELIGLPHCGAQMPHMLSGGEQQRVALARALAPSPALILLDEPFNSLDYQLRVQLRQDIRDILRKESVSVILVTHDQDEAFTFADRMVVMKSGTVMQEGLPKDIYYRPTSLWVASFVGEANILPAEVGRTLLSEAQSTTVSPSASTILIRPEDVLVRRVSPETAQGMIQQIDFFGDQQVLKIALDQEHSITANVPSRDAWHLKETVSLQVQHFTEFDGAA